MPDLTRSQFCTMASISADALASLSRRGQLPFSIDQKATGRGYSYFEAYLTNISQSLIEGHGVNVTRAAEIAARLPPALRVEWPRIVDTSWKLCGGTDERVEEILCGQAVAAGLQRPTPVCGTMMEIARGLSGADRPNVWLVLTNASRCLAVLINKAAHIKVEIPDEFWTGPFVYRERPDGFDLAKISMQKILASGFMPADDEPKQD